MSLYHAYRPQTFADIVGQDHVKQTLAASVARGEVAHAYLFSGPRGIGKTSIARILAMAVNCESRAQLLASSFQLSGKKTAAPKSSKLKAESSSEPCGECPSCLAVRGGNDLNVIEIDAASNRGIDEIRQLKENIGFAPSTSFGVGPMQQARKVYIIDEVHMLTKEAFNALLKTLEEPPAHAIFILATTELHRVPDTIISRTQHFTFKRATIADTRTHLGMIAGKEGLTLSPEATELIALHADGAFRDALSLLDQLAALGEQEITAEHVRLLLGIAPEAELLELLTASLSADAPGIHGALNRFAEQGYDPAALCDALITTLRHILWVHYGMTSESSELLAEFATKQAKEQSPAVLIQCIERLIVAKQQLRWSPLPMLPLELALLPTQEDPNLKHQVPNKSQTPSSKSQTTTLAAHHPRIESGAGSELVSGSDKRASSLPVVIQSAPDSSQEVEESTPVVAPDLSTSGATEAASDAQDDTSETSDDRRQTIGTGQPPLASSVSRLASSSKEQSFVDPTQLDELWTKLLAKIRPKNAQLAALLKSSKLLSIAEGSCQIEVPFSFYADRIKDRKNAGIITAAIEAETGVATTIRCSVAGTQTLDARRQTSGDESKVKGQLSNVTSRTQDDVAKDVMEVFGVSEVASAPVEEVVNG